MTFLLLLIFSYNIIFLFVGTASLGLFLSSTFPSMLAYTEDILQYKGEWWRNTEACSLQLVATSSPAPSLLWNSRPGLAFTGKIKMPTGLVRASMFGHGSPVRGFLCLLCVLSVAFCVSCVCPCRPQGSLAASSLISFLFLINIMGQLTYWPP